MTKTPFSGRIATTLAAGTMLMTAAAALAQATPDRGVFVTQIGDGPRARIIQRNPDSLAEITQDGADNQLDLAQEGPALHSAQIEQRGDDNRADVQQDGDGSTDLDLVQEGNRNIALIAQTEQSALAQSVAAIIQRGNDNSINLRQNGSDNRAQLIQEGNNNVMSATQLNNGNRLFWTQIGDGLPDLQIVQEGGATLQITQSNAGVAFAPPPGG